MTDDEREKWLEGAEYYGDALENRNLVPVMAEDEIDVTVSFPAVKYDRDPTSSGAKPQGFRQIYFKTFYNKITDLAEEVSEATDGLAELKATTQIARDGALAATVGAENVNAEISGMTVTITNRDGQSTSVDLSFDFYNTYASVAEMNADAANIPVSSLVSIATTDPTSAENARVYQKRSDGQMIYLFDLDQASAEAWAEWLETMKPQIQAAINQAASDHTRAESDHTTAAADHTTAASDHTQAGTDHQQYSTDHQTFLTNEANRQSTFETNEAQRQQDFENAEDARMTAMVVTECYVDTDTMELMFVQPDAGTIDYNVNDGYLDITVDYEDEMI